MSILYQTYRIKIVYYKMQTLFNKFIETSDNKPPESLLFPQFSYMEHEIRKSYKQLKQSKGAVSKPNEDFVNYWKEIGTTNRQQQVAVYLKWIQLLQKSFTNVLYRQLKPLQTKLFIKKSMITKWQVRKVSLNGLDLQIFSKKLKIYPLKCFCIRKSKNKDHFSWVMQVVMQLNDSKFKSFHLGTNHLNQFEQWYRQLQSRIQTARIHYFKESIGSQGTLKIEPNFKNQDVLQQSKNKKQQVSKSQEIKYRTKTLTETLIEKELKSIETQGFQNFEQKAGQQISSKTHPNIFLRIFPNKQLNNFCENLQNGNLLQCDEHYRLFENQGNLKIFITIKNTPSNVFRAISQSHSNWNPQINSFSVKNKISSQNSALIYQKHKSKGFLYKQRDFLFLRHCFTVQQDSDKKKIFMIQKSIDSIQHPPFMTVTRGQIELIWCIVGNRNEKQCMLIVEGLIKGGGYMNSNQDKQSTIKSFKLLLQLDNYLKQINYRKNHSDSYLFDESWLVSFKKSQEQFFDLEGEIQLEQFKEITKQQSQFYKKQMLQLQNCNQGMLTERKQSEFRQFIKQTSQEYKQQEQKTKDQQIHSPSVQNFGDEYVPPQLNPDRSVVIPKTFLRKKHRLQPKPKEKQAFAEIIRGHHLWKGQWALSSTGGLLYVDEQKMKAQKKVLTFIIKRIGKSIVTGKGVLNMSLPVDIFCKESNIQRCAMSFGYFPIFLEKVINASAMEQLKAIIPSFMGMAHIYLTMEKPFNPILGETYQCWIDGCPIYFQQISHHPPISAYLMKGRGYDLYGSFEAKMDLSINSGTGVNEGIFTVKFQNGRTFHYTTAPGELSGITYGERKLLLVEKSYVWSVQEGIFLQLVYNPISRQSKLFGSKRNYMGEQKLHDYFEGIIRKYNPQDLKEFLTPKKNQSRTMTIPKSLPPQQPISQHQKVWGRWSKHVYFGNEKIFDVDQNIHLRYYDQKYPLPSHSNFREDVVFRRLNQFVQAQEWKEILEAKQRKDKKLREQFKKKTK